MSRRYDMCKNVQMYSMCVYVMLRTRKKPQFVSDLPIGYRRVSTLTKQQNYTTKQCISIDSGQKNSPSTTCS